MPASTPPIDQFLYREYGSAIFPLLFPSDAQLVPPTTTREVTYQPTAATAGSTSGALTNSDRQRTLAQRAKMTLRYVVNRAKAKVRCVAGHEREPEPQPRRRRASVRNSAWSEWEMVTDSGER